jgi:ketosteroid isomerase-like protein
MTDHDEQAIRVVIDELIDALNKGDAERLRQHFSRRPDAVHIGTDAGEWWTSQQFVDGVDEQASSGIQVVLGDVSIHVAGDVAWTESRGHFSNQAGGTRPVWETAVFVRENGGWKCVQSHASIGVPNEEIFG